MSAGAVGSGILTVHLLRHGLSAMYPTTLHCTSSSCARFLMARIPGMGKMATILPHQEALPGTISTKQWLLLWRRDMSWQIALSCPRRRKLWSRWAKLCNVRLRSCLYRLVGGECFDQCFILLGLSLRIPRGNMKLTSLIYRCTFTAEHGKRIGWTPQFPAHHIVDTADEEVELILSNSTRWLK